MPWKFNVFIPIRIKNTQSRIINYNTSIKKRSIHFCFHLVKRWSSLIEYSCKSLYWKANNYEMNAIDRSTLILIFFIPPYATAGRSIRGPFLRFPNTPHKKWVKWKDKLNSVQKLEDWFELKLKNGSRQIKQLN